MNLPDFLTLDDDGWIHVTDHRIGLVDIIFFYRRGDSPEMLHLRFPTITLSTIYRVIAHYLDHREEVDSYVDESLAATEAMRATAVRRGPTYEELLDRMVKRRLPTNA